MSSNRRTEADQRHLFQSAVRSFADSTLVLAISSFAIIRRRISEALVFLQLHFSVENLASKHP